MFAKRVLSSKFKNMLYNIKNNVQNICIISSAVLFLHYRFNNKTNNNEREKQKIFSTL